MVKRGGKKSNVWKVVGLTGLAGAALVPGLDIVAIPALIAVLVGFSTKGK